MNTLIKKECIETQIFKQCFIYLHVLYIIEQWFRTGLAMGFIFPPWWDGGSFYSNLTQIFRNLFLSKMVNTHISTVPIEIARV